LLEGPEALLSIAAEILYKLSSTKEQDTKVMLTSSDAIFLVENSKVIMFKGQGVGQLDH